MSSSRGTEVYSNTAKRNRVRKERRTKRSKTTICCKFNFLPKN